LSKLFKKSPPRRIQITKEIISQWLSFEKLLIEGKVRFDKKGRLRYLHGAPVGDLILNKINKDDSPKYTESTEEWFDPGSQTAKIF